MFFTVYKRVIKAPQITARGSRERFPVGPSGSRPPDAFWCNQGPKFANIVEFSICTNKTYIYALKRDNVAYISTTRNPRTKCKRKRCSSVIWN